MKESFYNDLFETLYIHKVRYLLCGDLAVNIHGVARMTADIDIILDFEVENLRRYTDCAKTLHYRSVIPLAIEALADEKIRKDLINNKNMAAYSYFSESAGFMNIDVLIDLPVPFSELWENKTERSFMGKYIINVLSFDDLIRLKKYSNRIQDRSDIELLLKLRNEKPENNS